jgi:uncharacterized membrane protein (DUF485 family)
MIDSFIGTFLATLSLRDLYFQWESAGVFEFFLPALLIFAVSFAVLTSTNILGKNRGISLLISLAIAILAIRAPIVSEFFTVIFPGFGIGIAILVIALIMTGLFIHKANWHIFSNAFSWGGLIIAVIIAIAVINNFNWFGSVWWMDNWTTVLWIVLLVAAIAPFLQDPESEQAKVARRQEYSNAFPVMSGVRNT